MFNTNEKLILDADNTHLRCKYLQQDLKEDKG